MGDIIKLLRDFARNPENVELNYALAIHYESIGQWASAISYFLRTAERTTNKNLAYECMLKIGLGFERQGRRGNSARGAFKHALMILPKRPEAYFLISRYYERIGDHVMGYTMAQLGIETSDQNQPPLRSWVEYPGFYGLVFEKMVCSWWWGKPDECRALLQELKNKYAHQMDSVHYNATQNNLIRLGCGPGSQAHQTYWSGDYPNLRFKFSGSENITRNYSQVYQDMFVLSMLNGKQAGTYLEIGSAGPEYGNNTKLLEILNWNGYGIDFDENFIKEYRANRRNPVLHQNALEVNYDDLLSKIAVNGVVDYLQLDCEPSNITYDIMTKIPFDKYRFRVITYEHDHYVDMSGQYRQKSRDFLTARGYVLMVNDVSPDGVSNFEDWYVHPDLVDRNILRRMKSVTGATQHAREYMLPGHEEYSPAGFDWGEIKENRWFYALCDTEVFGKRIYDRFVKVEKGDVVVDLGASVGPFAVSILGYEPKMICCVEPHSQLFKTLVSNLQRANPPMPVHMDNIAIADRNGEFATYGLFDKESKESLSKMNIVNGITFESYLSMHNITRIDYLKCDCEGGEYDIFRADNVDWILANVKKISGEWHLSNAEMKEKFRRFRDTYLTRFKNFRVYANNDVDITADVWKDQFITYYNEILIAIDNRE